MFKKATLTNGLRIITAPMQGTNTVTVLVLCGTGSDYESKDINGISHFLEHMFFKGTKKRPEAETISQELDGMGAVYNAFTSHELTGYFIKAGKSYNGQALEILADIYKNSLLSADEIEKEKQVIIEEYHKDLDTPTIYVWWIWESLLYGDQPAGWDVIGEEKVIRSLRRDNFTDYFFHQYVASNTAIIVAGNFDEGKVIRDVGFLFGDLRSDPPVRTKPSVMEEQKAPSLKVHYKETDQTHLVIGFRGYGAGHPRRFMAEVLATILGGGMSSRMFVQIREKMGLAYTVWTSYEEYSNRGFLTTYSGVSHENSEKTLKAVLDEYKKILDHRVSGAELKKVKDYIHGTTLIGLEQSNAVASFVGTEEMVTGSPMTVDEVFAKLEAVTLEDVYETAKEIMAPERLNLAVIGPFKDGMPFQKLLDNF